MLVGYSAPCLPVVQSGPPGSTSYVDELWRHAQHVLMLRWTLAPESSIQWAARIKRLRQPGSHMLRRIFCELSVIGCECFA